MFPVYLVVLDSLGSLGLTEELDQPVTQDFQVLSVLQDSLVSLVQTVQLDRQGLGARVVFQEAMGSLEDLVSADCPVHLVLQVLRVALAFLGYLVFLDCPALMLEPDYQDLEEHQVKCSALRFV